MSNIDVQQSFNGNITEFHVLHEVTNAIPEVGIDLLLRRYVRRILHAARRGLGCYKFYVVFEAYFQVNRKIKSSSSRLNRTTIDGVYVRS